jgi:menaquinone-9 beta-reductase
MRNVIVIGGGLAGLLSAIQLSRLGIACTLIEKKQYPFHRVCGEYISNEVVSFLKSIEAYPQNLPHSNINRLQLSATNGKSSFLSLPLGGFGISRYLFDHFLYEKAKHLGVVFLLNTEVKDVVLNGDRFVVTANDAALLADVVIGCFGKRSKADVVLRRSFIKKRSPYVGVKYHVKTNFSKDLVALHNFEGGYCGVSTIGNDTTNLCYLIHRDAVRRHKTIQAAESEILCKNPHLKELFLNSDFLFNKPEIINEISFATKEPVHKHILMAGDAAGMITPLCGNGMAMAIHSSKVVSELVLKFCTHKNYSRAQLEKDYAAQWKKLFSSRLWAGRQIQKLFGSNYASNIAIHILIKSPTLANAIVKRTHGKEF